MAACRAEKYTRNIFDGPTCKKYFAGRSLVARATRNLRGKNVLTSLLAENFPRATFRLARSAGNLRGRNVPADLHGENFPREACRRARAAGNIPRENFQRKGPLEMLTLSFKEALCGLPLKQWKILLPTNHGGWKILSTRCFPSTLVRLPKMICRRLLHDFLTNFGRQKLYSFLVVKFNIGLDTRMSWLIFGKFASCFDKLF